MATSCPICGAALPIRSGPGRPRTYCTPACAQRRERSVARVRLREAVRRREVAELRAILAGEPAPWWWVGTREQVAARLAELGRG